VRLEPLELWLPAAPGPLLPRLRAALADHARHRSATEPLRWAVTGSDPARGLRIEAVLLIEDG
jgi:hypothetical protein